MPSFCSFLVFKPNEIDLIHSICARANWSTQDILDPSSKYRFTERGMSEISQASALSDYGLLREGEEYGRLLVFETEQEEADNIIQLICAANLILEAFPDRHNPPSHGFPISDDPTKREEIFELVFRTNGYFQKFTHRETLPVAVAVAARAWGNMKLVYAIHKLALSFMTESVTPHSMHPRNGQIFEKHTSDFASHVGTSVAINLAYSTIEELGLGVGASGERPRSLSTETFEWNPEVLEPFKKRLKASGVDPDRTIDWVSRGDKSEVAIYAMLDSPSDYSDGELVRDRKVALPDAINFCEYLRNQMTAHVFSSSTPRLGPYEVYNTQQVARFLTLSKCGLFNVWTEGLRTRY
jgi:hypothetical protein